MLMSQSQPAAAAVSYDQTLVALSYVISVLGSLSGLQSARCVRTRSGRAAIAWLVAAAVSIGGGAVWSMHFIGMLAYRIIDVHYSLDLTVTLTSWVVSVAAAGAGLYVASRGAPTVPRIVGAGVITGLGVVAMHYTGMSAMRMHGDLSYRPAIVALSVVIAVVAASAALLFAFTLTKVWAMLAAAFVMGVAVCGMHYTAMAAAVVSAHVGMSPVSGVDPLSLALPVFSVTSVLLFVLLFVGLFQDAAQHDVAVAAS
jgi:NO-binding membrane sensor protein with MHYT domain